ncbi:MAG: alpha-ketoacid dehydrogenase subunit beta [Betaproteobacteria bacterium]|nr:alpha-ketoacid dehydrogenase subunit beta [Betaproteobacteria bacterium]MDE2209865.1 alpha-ketoacid dehydrogenase subunit beta [Betaproteobacteria bacterium]
MAKKRMVQAINEAITEEMERDGSIIVLGEDVHISPVGDTRGLIERFGAARVRNTPISESVMSGMAVGAAATGSRVICHLFYGNFIYTGFDAIANQAAKLRYMLGGQVKLPILYMAMIGGGRSVAAQHSDSMHPMLMNLGGIKIVMPASPGDAKGLVKAALRDDNPVFLLQAAGRGGELGEVPDGDYTIPLGKAEEKRVGDDVTVVAIGSMVKPALKACDELAARGISVSLIDPRTVVPMDYDAILASVARTGRLVVVDEARKSCSAASEIAATVAERGFHLLKAPIGRVAVEDVAMPYSPVLEKAVIPDAARIVDAVLKITVSRGVTQ